MIFSGSLGFNLDPWQTVEEEELKSVLQRIGARQSKKIKIHFALNDKLNSVVQRKKMVIFNDICHEGGGVSPTTFLQKV